MAGFLFNKNDMNKDNININELKEKYGELKEISCDGLTAYFRKPDMKIWRFALKAIEKSQTEFKKSLAINCFVAGDKELLESPYIEDIAEMINEFVDYPEPEVEREGNAWRIKVLDKSARFKPLTIEIQTLAERNNPDDIPFKTQENLMDLMWIDGDEELRDPKQLDYHIPALSVMHKLREKHLLSIKKV